MAQTNKSLLEQPGAIVVVPKPLWQSRTLWANVLGTLVALAAGLPPEYGMPAMAVLNILLRLISRQPVTLIPGADG